MRNLSYLLSFLILLMAEVVAAQPGGGGGGGPGGGEPVPLPGLGILLAAGAFLGIRSIVKKRKGSSQN